MHSGSRSTIVLNSTPVPSLKIFPNELIQRQLTLCRWFDGSFGVVTFQREKERDDKKRDDKTEESMRSLELTHQQVHLTNCLQQKPKQDPKTPKPTHHVPSIAKEKNKSYRPAINNHA